jgi:hypothetical protein
MNFRRVGQTYDAGKTLHSIGTVAGWLRKDIGNYLDRPPSTSETHKQLDCLEDNVKKKTFIPLVVEVAQKSGRTIWQYLT